MTTTEYGLQVTNRPSVHSCFFQHYLTRDLQRRLGLLKQGAIIFTLIRLEHRKTQPSNDLNSRQYLLQTCTMGTTHEREEIGHIHVYY